MKVTVTKTDVSVEGEATEIREAMPSILGVDQPAAMVVQGDEPALLDAPEPPLSVQRREALQQPFHVSETGTAEVVNAATPILLDEKPRDWEDIPAELRVWNAIGTTCHIAKNPNDLYVTWCGADVGRVRPADMEPRTQASPCGNCLRRMAEAARP